VLVCLADFADDYGKCFPSVDTIAERTGLNSRSVRRAISDIEKQGLITRSFCTGKRTDYIINPCHSVTPDTVSPLTESTLPLTQSPIPLTESTLTPDRGVNITTINHHESSLTTITELAPAKAVAKRSETTGARLPSDWQLPKALGEWATEQGMTRECVIAEADRFRDYWIAQPGAKGRKTDWPATWRNWIRNRKPDNTKSFAEQSQDFKNAKAEKFYKPLLEMSDEDKKAWGFPV
jgi:hypothetical protein